MYLSDFSIELNIVNVEKNNQTIRILSIHVMTNNFLLE